MVVDVCHGLMLSKHVTLPEKGTCDLLITSDLLSFNLTAIK